MLGALAPDDRGAARRRKRTARGSPLDCDENRARHRRIPPAVHAGLLSRIRTILSETFGSRYSGGGDHCAADALSRRYRAAATIRCGSVLATMLLPDSTVSG